MNYSATLRENFAKYFLLSLRYNRIDGVRTEETESLYIQLIEGNQDDRCECVINTTAKKIFFFSLSVSPSLYVIWYTPISMRKMGVIS